MSGPPTGRRSTTSLRVAGVLWAPRKKQTKTIREKKTTTTTFQRRIGENRRSLTPIQTDSERRKTKKKEKLGKKKSAKGTLD